MYFTKLPSVLLICLVIYLGLCLYVLMSVTISAYKLYEGSYLIYVICVFAYGGVRHMLCCVLVLHACFASFSGLSIFGCPSLFSNVYVSRFVLTCVIDCACR